MGSQLLMLLSTYKIQMTLYVFEQTQHIDAGVKGCSSSNSENSTEVLWDQPSFSFFWACSQNFLISPCTQKNIKQIKNESDVSTKHRKLCWPVLHFFIDTRKKMTTVSQTLQWLSCSNSKFLLHSAGEIWKHDEFDLWPFQADFTLTQLFKTKAVTTLLFIRRTESLKSSLRSKWLWAFFPEGLSGQGSADFLKQSCSPAWLQQEYLSGHHD